MSNAQTQVPNYEVRFGPLADTYGLFVPSTISTGAQISADRIEDESLRDEWFYTANVPLATKRGGKLLLGIGGNRAFNVVFGTSTGEVCQQLRGTKYVCLTPDKKDQVLVLERSGEVAFVDPTDLCLEGCGAEYRYFPIRTRSYQDDVSVARMPFVSAGYGSGCMLERVMNNLVVKGGISETTVFTMSPDHVAECVKDDEIVARASGLDYFDYNSSFNAYNCLVYYHNGLRGVLKNPAEGGPKKTDSLERLV